MPVNTKTYDTDTDNNADGEEKQADAPAHVISTLDDFDQLPEHLRTGIVGQILKQNEEAQRKRDEKKEEEDHNCNLMAGLEDIALDLDEDNVEKDKEPEQDSDVAPVSPFADAPTTQKKDLKKEEAEKKLEQFHNAIQAVSS